MRRVIVTGATGFVGANLARRLVNDGHDVHILVRPGYVTWRIEGLGSAITPHVVDLIDGQVVAELVSQISPSWVFHLAAYGAYPCQTSMTRMVQTNILGTTNLVEACTQAGVEALVSAGSSSEYGAKDHPPAESDSTDPNSAYAVTKLSATLACRELARSSGMRIATLRLYSVFGPFEEPTRLFPTLVVRGLGGELPPLANPRTAHDFVFVDDVVDAFVLAASRAHTEAGAIFNVGTGTQSSLADVMDLACRVLSIPARPAWETYADRMWDTPVWIAESSKARRVLGWQPRYTLEAGFRVLVQWFTENPEYLRRYADQLGAPLANMMGAT
jgi:nucleoside-diphosphate-sugar epimerase